MPATIVSVSNAPLTETVRRWPGRPDWLKLQPQRQLSAAVPLSHLFVIFAWLLNPVPMTGPVPFTQTRRAFLWASAGRYLVMAINLISTLIMARLLTPGDYGVSVLGGAVLAIAEAVRALGGGSYLIQKADLTPQNIRATFTVSFCVTIGFASMLMLACGPLTRYFDLPALGRYVPAATLGFLAGPIVNTVMALMSREMAFGAVARIGLATAAVNAAVGIGLAAYGFGYMSFAWAGTASAFAGLVLYLRACVDFSIFRPSLRGCRGVIAFGTYDGITALMWQVGQLVPYLILGRVMDATSVGLAQRAVTLCLFPERVILAGVGAVALPAFSQQTREGGRLKNGYLHAIALITVTLWPALILLALLAEPVVAVLLGPNWLAAAPLVQIVSVELLFSFPACLQYPVLVASGHIRQMPPLVLIQSVTSIGILYMGARHGLHATALSLGLVVPLNGLLALLLARFATHFQWRELAHALSGSLLCTLCGAAGPALLVWNRGFAMPLPVAVLAGGLTLAGWAGGLVLTRHPLLGEMLAVAQAGRRKVTNVGL